MRDRSRSDSGSKQSSYLSHNSVKWKDSEVVGSDSSSDFVSDDFGHSGSQAVALRSSGTFDSSGSTGPEPAILIMGVTGSGKSSFISRLTDDDIAIGHSLESCKQACNAK